jgi:PAS domain S-box-containing protein
MTALSAREVEAVDTDGLLKELRCALGKMDQVVGALHEGIVWTNALGRIQWCNSAFARLVDRSVLRLIGQPLAAVLKLRPAEPDSGYQHPVDRILTGRAGPRPIREVCLLDRAGAVRTVEIQCATAGSCGCASSIVMVLRDISDRAMAETFLEQANARADFLRRVAAAANAARDPNLILREVLELLCSHLQWPAGRAVPVLDAGSDAACLEPVWHLSDGARYGYFRLLTDRMPPLRDFTSGMKPALAPLANSACREAAAICGLRTCLVFPVPAGEQVAAVVELFTPEEPAWDADLFELAGQVGAQLGLVYERTLAGAALLSEKNSLERHVAERTAELSALNRSLIEEVRERRRIEETLRESTDRHENLVRSMQDVFFSVSAGGRIEELNNAFEQLTGLSRSQWLGARAARLIHPGERRLAMRWFLRCRSRNVPPPIELRLRTVSGGWIIVEGSLNPRFANGALVNVAGIGRDITGRRAVERELRLREQAMASTTEGIFLIDGADPERPVSYSNPGLEAMTGQAGRDTLGNPWRCLFPAVPADSVAAIEKAMDQGEPGVIELRITLSESASRWCRIALTPVVDARESLTHFVGIVSDITQQKEAERVKNELVATVSHELRTPLTSLRGFAELMLERDYPPEKQKKFLGIINKEATRLTNLINDFLDIQRIESGRQIYHFDKLAVVPLLEETAALFRGSNTAHEFRVSAEEACFNVWADPDRLRQVLFNLVSNAVKFSPAGGVVELRVRRDGIYAICSVADHGVGIPPEALPKLFTKFYRVDNTDTRKIGGTGLGLALVKEIVEAHKGRIWVESERGRGSIFSFAVPLV